MSQLVSLNHSGLYKSMIKAGSSDAFLYDASPSSKPLSNQLLKVSPQSQFSDTIVATTMEFNIPRDGFLSQCILKFNVEMDDAAGAESSWAGCEYVQEVSLQSRGHILRRADSLALEHEISYEPNYSKRLNQENMVRKALANTASGIAFATRPYYLNVGRALGISSHPKNAYDCSFVEPLTLVVKFRAPGDVNSCSGAKYNNTCYLYTVFSKMNAADYDAFVSEQYSDSSPMKRLITSWESENDYDITNTGVGVKTTNVNIYVKGLLVRSAFALQNKTLRDVAEDGTTKDRCSFNAISSVTLYANGQRVWECDDAILQKLMLQSNQGAIVSATTNVLALKVQDPDNIFVLDYSQMNLPNEIYDAVHGALNTADLSSVYLAITWTPAAANNFIARVVHKTLMLEQVDSRSGFVSTSAKV